MDNRRLIALTLCIAAACAQALAQRSGPDTFPADTPQTGDMTPPLTAHEDPDSINQINAEIDRRADDATAGSDGAFGNGAASPDFGSMLPGLLALCIVLALILGIYYGVRRWGKKVPLLAGPGLGALLGRIHLERGTALHFVRTAGRVLVIGANNNSISLLADFDAALFDQKHPEETTEAAPAPFNPDSFLAQLQASSEAMGRRVIHDQPKAEDDEIAALRGDIQRLQRYLREESRESQD